MHAIYSYETFLTKAIQLHDKIAKTGTSARFWVLPHPAEKFPLD